MKTAPVTTLNPDQRELVVNAMAWAIGLVDQLPAHLVRALFRDEACRLLEEYSGISNSEKSTGPGAPNAEARM